MTSTAQTLARAAATAAFAALCLTTSVAAQTRPRLILDQTKLRRISDKILRIERDLPIAEHVVVVATGAEWHPGSNSLFFNGILTNADFIGSALDTDNRDTLPMEALAWSADGSRIVLHTGTALPGSRDTLHIIPLAANAQTGPVVIPTGTFLLTQTDFSPQGSKLVVAAANGLTVYDGASGRQLQRFAPQRSGSAEDNGTESASAPAFFDWSNDDGRLLVGFVQGTTGQQNRVSISVLNGSTLQFIRAISAESGATVARFHPGDNTRMLVAGTNVAIVNTANGSTLRTIPVGRRIRTAQWRRDGAQILTVTEDNTWQVWDAATGAQVRSGAGREAVFNPGGSKLAVLNGTAQSGQANTTITVQNASTGAVTQTIQQAGEFVNKLAWRPSGSGILGVNGRRVHIWRVH